MKKSIYKTYSVYDVAHCCYLHISATSKAHVKENQQDKSVRGHFQMGGQVQENRATIDM